MTKALSIHNTEREGARQTLLLLAKGRDAHCLLRLSATADHPVFDRIRPADDGENYEYLTRYGNFSDVSDLVNVIAVRRSAGVESTAEPHSWVALDDHSADAADGESEGTLRLVATSAGTAGRRMHLTSEAASTHRNVAGVLFADGVPERGETFISYEITRAVALFDADFAQYADQDNADAIRDSRHVQDFAEGFWRALGTYPRRTAQRRLTTVGVPVRHDAVPALNRDAPTFVAGHRGMVGSAILRRLTSDGFTDLRVRPRDELDLTDRAATFTFFERNRPEVVVLAAARVGGILANSTQPVDFLSENLQIQVNVLDAALHVGVRRLLFLGSSCIYPKLAAQPLTEDALLTGPLEPTNDAYAIAKIAGILQVQAVRRQYGLPWISAMPTNLYGPGDNFSATSSHVLPAMIRRYDEARAAGEPTVTNWGSGQPRREFLHVDDLADACLHLLEHFDGPQQVNVGTGEDHTIAEIADLVADAVHYTGQTHWDTTKPDGTPRKLLDISTLRESGWRPNITLANGIADTIDWYRSNQASVRT